VVKEGEKVLEASYGIEYCYGYGHFGVGVSLYLVVEFDTHNIKGERRVRDEKTTKTTRNNRRVIVSKTLNNTAKRTLKIERKEEKRRDRRWRSNHF